MTALSALDLSSKMVETLRWVMLGVRKYRDGYHPIDDPAITISSRTLDALHKRGLIWWQSVGGATQHISLRPTEKGEVLYYALEEGRNDASLLGDKV